MRYPAIPAPDPTEAALAAVRRYCGWHVAPEIIETLTLDGNGERRMLLPTRRVVDLERAEIDGEPVELRWSEDGWITRPDGVFPDRERSVEVTIVHGFDSADDVGQVVQSIIARARMSPAGNIVSQSTGPFRVQYAAAGGEAAGFPLMQSEKAALNHYRLTWGP